MSELSELAKESRLKVLDLVYEAQTSHVGSLLGAADIFAVLFSKIDLDKDKLILSAGWKTALLYFHLWKKGKITLEELDSYCKRGSKFIGLAEPIHLDIPFAGGSMGYGLPAAVGFALAKKLKNEEGIVYCYMSDGEVAIGTTWEASLIAAHYKLDNLIVIVERNGWQAVGKVNDILPSHFPNVFYENPPRNGWYSHYNLNGHDLSALDNKLESVIESKRERPTCLTIDTIKGKGVSFMENDNLWHYKAPSKEEYKKALIELNV